MKEDREKKLDAFVRQIVKEVALEEPSENFTKNVLSKIDEVSVAAKTVSYTPLISKPVWYVLALVTSLLLISTFIGNIEFDFFLKNSNFLANLSENSPTLNLPNISFSNIVVYAALALGFFVYVQIYLLKKSWIQNEVSY
ncbi:MAG: hypothetical protein HKM92_02355 [Arenibacter sp.]|nr:hypothetical protein [Eudoraea sp.]NNG08984.1 hypothetical protein [Arenibacter sp.]